MKKISIGNALIEDSNIIHDSTGEEYRNPTGAVAEGTEILLALKISGIDFTYAHLKVLRGETVDSVKLVSGVHDNQNSMNGSGGAVLYARYTAPASESGGQTLWYWFEIGLTCGATCYYGAEPPYPSGLGRIYQNPPPAYQISVYDRDFKTPDWAKTSIMYQIFPDRFSMGDPDRVREGVAYHRSKGRTEIELRENWKDVPVFEAKEGQAFYMPCDIYGGDLEGIRKRLPYLKELGISLIYLNPIFEATSNHRYNTGDYMKIDPILGDNEAFRTLAKEAKEAGIRIILDGVFSHTGDDSVYFNKYGRYEETGAYQSKDSKYYGWYKFDFHPDRYESWWGFESLPEVNEDNPSWQEFVISGKDSVVRHWLKEGAAGYRLDVADELPDDTIAQIRVAAKEEDPDAFLLGEVWEDATTKLSYGKQRTYALGLGLDSVMNYPFLNATTDFLKEKMDAWHYSRFLLHQQHSYPAQMYYTLMNMTSTHDVCRIRSALATDRDLGAMSRAEQAHFGLSAEEFALGGKRQRLAAAIQFSLPGIPAVYYGDEAGMTGLLDPFNRRGFHEDDPAMIDWYKWLGNLRQSRPVMSTGHARFFATNGNVLGILRHSVFRCDFFGREIGSDAVMTVVNPTMEPHRIVLDLGEVAKALPKGRIGEAVLEGTQGAVSLMTGRKAPLEKGLIVIEMDPLEAEIFGVA